VIFDVYIGYIAYHTNLNHSMN